MGKIVGLIIKEEKKTFTEPKVEAPVKEEKKK